MEANESIEEVKGNQQHGHWPWGTRQLHGSFTTLGSWTLIGLNMRSLTPSGMRGHGCPFRAHGHHHEMRLKCRLSGRERCCRPSSMVVICWDIVGGHRHSERTWVTAEKAHQFLGSHRCLAHPTNWTCGVSTTSSWTSD